jgi:hypothetical protein
VCKILPVLRSLDLISVKKHSFGRFFIKKNRRCFVIPFIIKKYKKGFIMPKVQKSGKK